MKTRIRKGYLVKWNGQYFPSIVTAAKASGVNNITLQRYVQDETLRSRKDEFKVEVKGNEFFIKIFK